MNGFRGVKKGRQKEKVFSFSNFISGQPVIDHFTNMYHLATVMQETLNQLPLTNNLINRIKSYIYRTKYDGVNWYLLATCW